MNKQGQFQSDRHPNLAPDKIILSFKDKHALIALGLYAKLTDDRELAEDIIERIKSISSDYDSFGNVWL